MKFFTVGYGGRRPEEFMALLQSKGVRVVVDVRLRPDRANMGVYTRARSSDKGIEALLAKHGMEYRSFIELGNIFVPDGDFGYAEQVWPELYPQLFARVGDLLTARLADVPTPFCLLCAEKDVAACHRRVIAEYLIQQGHEVEHL